MVYQQNEYLNSCLNSMTDEALCEQACNLDREAEEVLVRRYYSMVRACARPLFLFGGDGEDLIQEGMFGLLRAIREYRTDKGSTFHTFAEKCIRNCLYSALRTFSGDKHSPLNQSVSLDAPFFDSDSCASGAFDLDHSDPELLVIEQDRVEFLLESTCKQLSEFEAKILRYYLEGLTVKEISDTVGKSPKSVDNAVQRVRRKAARQLSSGDISKG